jgi:hypothetical protein
MSFEPLLGYTIQVNNNLKYYNKFDTIYRVTKTVFAVLEVMLAIVSPSTSKLLEN